MIIDMHTHVYPEKIAKRAVEKLSKAADIPAQSNGMKSGLQESMKRAGVDYSLLLPVATSVKQVDKMNQEAVAANECAGETGLISFGAIHPDTPDYKEVLSWLADHDVRGIKLHPDYQGTFFDDIRMERIVDKATELGLYTVVHGGIDIGLPDPIHCTPARTVKVLQDTETDKLIVAHMGGWTLWDEVEELLIGRNVYLDTSFSIDCLEGVQGLLNKERFTRMVRDHGADRISVNPQSLEPRVLSAIGRKHSPEDIEKAMELATSMGFPHVNMDLIAGLPADTPEGFRRTLDTCLTFGADNITVHTLSLKKGSRILLEGLPIPSAEDVAAMLDYADPALREKGFAPYYLYRQKYMSGSFENVGWCISGAEGLYNIYIMEELHSILSLGAGGSTKMVDAKRNRIERVFHPKFPLEYIQRPEKLTENLEAFRRFHQEMAR